MKPRFGDVEFDADGRQILRSGREVHVSTKAFELLALLLDRRPNAVSKDDIRRHLWPDTRKRTHHSCSVLGRRLYTDVQVPRRARAPVQRERVGADHEKTDVSVCERSQQIDEVLVHAVGRLAAARSLR